MCRDNSTVNIRYYTTRPTTTTTTRVLMRIMYDTFTLVMWTALVGL